MSSFTNSGHALTARKYGIPTRDITLLPIGGVARLERMPDDPRQELWVALAGPAVNVVLAAGLFILLQVTGQWTPLEQLSVTGGSFFERLLVVNVMLVIFNLLPAFPMDGGRVLRALLAMKIDYVRASQIAAGVGQGMALLFGFVGLFYNPFLIFIALFVWIGAQQEASAVMMRSSFGGIPVRESMVTRFRTLSPGDTLRRTADEILAGFQQDFPVMEGGRVVGILTRPSLMEGLARQRLDTPVADIMQRDFQAVDIGDMLDAAFQKLQSCQCRTMPVLDRGQLAGLLTMDNVGEFMSIQAALDQRRRGLRSSVFDSLRR